MDGDRFSRNIALFGREGQDKIEAERVGVVGLGGLGSHVVQQLTYLGVRWQAHVDDDFITHSSLNRVVTAHRSDPDVVRKVEAAERMARAVAADIQLATVAQKLETDEARSVLENCTSIFSCLDDDLARVALIEFSAQRRIPYFDLATDTGADANGAWYGGRVLFSGEGERCPACMDLLDQREMSRSSMTKEQRKTDDRIYGVKRDALEGTGPAVVSLNGVVASIGVMEWMVWVTGLRAPKPLLEYRGSAGGVFLNNDPPAAGCYYCGLWRG